MQIPNRRVHSMIDKLKTIEEKASEEDVQRIASELRIYLETNFKSKPNYRKNKSQI